MEFTFSELPLELQVRVFTFLPSVARRLAKDYRDHWSIQKAYIKYIFTSPLTPVERNVGYLMGIYNDFIYYSDNQIWRVSRSLDPGIYYDYLHFPTPSDPMSKRSFVLQNSDYLGKGSRLGDEIVPTLIQKRLKISDLPRLSPMNFEWFTTWLQRTTNREITRFTRFIDTRLGEARLKMALLPGLTKSFIGLVSESWSWLALLALASLNPNSTAYTVDEQGNQSNSDKDDQ